MIPDKIFEAIKNIEKKELIISIGTTSRRTDNFTVLPNRYLSDYKVVSFLISSESEIKETLKYIDGKAQYILLDVEKKKYSNIWELGREYLKHTIAFPYKPNDVTVEAADIQINHLFNYHLIDKRILVYGNGNIATKLALRLAERGAKVFMYGRNKSKSKEIVNVLNMIAPQCFNEKPVTHIENMENLEEDSLDGMISFISGDRVIDHYWLDYMKEHSIVIDGGINNFTSRFYELSKKKNIKKLRLDVRIAFSYVSLPIFGDSVTFFESVQGTKMFNSINLVAGGIIGEEGDIILDQIKNPTQIIGIANGLGGIKNEEKYQHADEENIKKYKNKLFDV